MSFNLPNSIATGSSDPYWASLVPSSTTANPDTATKKHYAAVGSGGPTDVVFELNNGVITVDVNASFTGTDWPTHISKTGFQNNASGSITVTTSDTIYLFNLNSTNFGSFVWQSSWTTSPGPTVTQTRTTHTGTIPAATGFIIRDPSPGPFYSKTGAHRFQIKYYDQNEPSYNLTVTWTTAAGTVSDVQTVTPQSGDIKFTYNFSANNASDQPITGPITVSLNADWTYNGTEYNAGDTIRTFQYYTTGPYTAYFSPNFGLPGQSVSVYIQDTNPYPDADTPTTFNMVANQSTTGISAPLNSANNYTQNLVDNLSGINAVTHGFYKIYNGSTVLATATYDTNYVAPLTTSNGEGKPDRYPLIMTNLFNRNRSLYSIGMTHKDDNLFL